MKIPNGYTTEPTDEWHEQWSRTTTGWLSYPGNQNKTPNCVPHLHNGHRAKVLTIHHKMEYSCECRENSDKVVSCILTLRDGREYYGTHLPGYCPGMKYRPRGRKKNG